MTQMSDDRRQARRQPTEFRAIRPGSEGAVWQSATSDFEVNHELFRNPRSAGSGAYAATEAATAAATG